MKNCVDILNENLRIPICSQSLFYHHRTHEQLLEKLGDYEKLRSFHNANYPDWALRLQDNLFLIPDLTEAVTKRIQTTGSNIQGLPKPLRPCVRMSDHFIISCDWVASHLYILSSITKDPVLSSDLEQKDFYLYLASLFDLERAQVKLGIFKLLNGSGIEGLTKDTGLSSSEAKRFKDLLEERWAISFAWRDELIEEATKTGFVEVNGKKLKIDPEKAHSALAYYLQYIEVNNLKKVWSTKIKGATPIIPMHDEIVWLVKPEYLEEAIEGIKSAMEEFAPCDLKYGPAWGVEGEEPCPHFENPKSLKKSIYYDFIPSLTLERKDLIDGKYLPPIDFNMNGTYLIQAPKGTGKTELISVLTNQFKYSHDIKMIVPRRSLADSASERLKIGNYQTLSSLDCSSVCCINSLKRIAKTPDILILDEVSQIFDSINHNGTPDKSEVPDLLAHLYYLIQETPLVICLDADLNGIVQRKIEQYRSHTKIEAISVDLKREDSRIIYQDKNELINHLIYRVKGSQKIAIACSALKDSQIIHRKLEQLFPEKKGLLINSKTKNNHEFIKDPDTWLLENNIDWLIYSPSITGGVSIDIEYFDYIYGFYKIGSVTAPEFDQMLGRVRKPKSSIYRVWLDKSGNKRITYAHEIYTRIHNRDAKNQALLKQNLQCKELPTHSTKYDFNDDGKLIIKEMSRIHDMYDKHWSASVAWRNRRGQFHSYQSYLEYLEANDVTYSFEVKSSDEAKQLKVELKEEKNKLKMEEIASIVEADISSPIEVLRVKEETELLYGVVNEQTVKATQKKGRKKLKMLKHVLSPFHNDLHSSFVEEDQQQLEQAISTRNHCSIKSKVIRDLLLETNILNPLGCFNPGNMDKELISRVMSNNIEKLEILNITLGKQNPFQVFSRILSDFLGIKKVEHRHREDGAIVRDYSIDLEWLELLIASPVFKGVTPKTSIVYIKEHFVVSRQDKRREEGCEIKELGGTSSKPQPFLSRIKRKVTKKITHLLE